MRYIVILNEVSGKSAKAAAGTSPDELRDAFAAAGVTAEVHAIAPDRLDAAIKAAVAAGPDAVVIGGGDGTVRCAAQALADTGIPLGVLPLGTLNHFAKDLQMPTDMPAAVAVLADGKKRTVDVGEINGHVFINNCSLGAYAEAVRRRDALRERRGLGKWGAMIRASFEEFRRLRRLRLRIRAEVEHFPGGDAPDPTGGSSNLRTTAEVGRLVRTPIVVVGNNRYSGSLFAQNLRPRLDEGRLWLYTVHARAHLAVIRMMFQSLFGRLDQADALAAEAATKIFIESHSGPVSVAADGESLKLSPPFHFRIRPGALEVIAPSGSENVRPAAKEQRASVRDNGRRAREPMLAPFKPVPPRKA